MADKEDKYEDNVAGKFYVDTECIDCNLCRELAPENFTKNITKLIINPKLLLKYQVNSFKNFYLTNKFASKEIDNYRKNFLNTKKLNFNISKLKICDDIVQRYFCINLMGHFWSIVIPFMSK